MKIYPGVAIFPAPEVTLSLPGLELRSSWPNFDHCVCPKEHVHRNILTWFVSISGKTLQRVQLGNKIVYVHLPSAEMPVALVQEWKMNNAYRFIIIYAVQYTNDIAHKH